MMLECSECKVYGARYLTAEPVSLQQFKDMMDWCYQQFGALHEPTKTPMARYYIYDSKFLFRDEQDYTLCLLRWA